MWHWRNSAFIVFYSSFEYCLCLRNQRSFFDGLQLSSLVNSGKGTKDISFHYASEKFQNPFVLFFIWFQGWQYKNVFNHFEYQELVVQPWSNLAANQKKSYYTCIDSPVGLLSQLSLCTVCVYCIHHDNVCLSIFHISCRVFGKQFKSVISP